LALAFWQHILNPFKVFLLRWAADLVKLVGIAVRVEAPVRKKKSQKTGICVRVVGCVSVRERGQEGESVRKRESEIVCVCEREREREGERERGRADHVKDCCEVSREALRQLALRRRYKLVSDFGI
jgi:hypothetical protein